MIKENGHRWEFEHPEARCLNCQIKYGYYLDIKRASKEQPKREDLKSLIKCGDKHE